MLNICHQTTSVFTFKHHFRKDKNTFVQFLTNIRVHFYTMDYLQRILICSTDFTVYKNDYLVLGLSILEVKDSDKQI